MTSTHVPFVHFMSIYKFILTTGLQTLPDLVTTWPCALLWPRSTLSVSPWEEPSCHVSAPFCSELISSEFTVLPIVTSLETSCKCCLFLLTSPLLSELTWYERCVLLSWTTDAGPVHVFSSSNFNKTWLELWQLSHMPHVEVECLFQLSVFISMSNKISVKPLGNQVPFKWRESGSDLSSHE